MSVTRTFAAASALLLAACSSGGGEASEDADVATTETAAAQTAAPPVEPADADAEPAESESPDDSGADAAEADAAGDAAAGDAAEGESTDDEVPNDGLVIDGPARVRPSCISLPTGVSKFQLEAGGGVHDVRIYVPAEASSDPVPTVLNWHGLGSNGPDQAAFTGYEALADEEGFVVVHATGLDTAGPRSWELTGLSDTPDRDDLAFADALIDTVVADWCADPARIYSTGMSNGGLFTSELVCNRSTRIAAAASVAGTTHPDTCQPERPVPYIAIHGTADTVVPFTPETESSLLPPEAVEALIGTGTPDEFAEFAADAGCSIEPSQVDETDEVIRYDYVDCSDGVPMAFYEIVGGGHTWPSSPLSERFGGDGNAFFTQDIDATVDAWAFMSQHSL